MEKKEINSNWKMSIETTLFFTILLSFIMNLVWYTLRDLSIFFIIFFYIGFLFEWPFCIILSFIIAIVIAIFKKTKLLIFEDKIIIRRFGFFIEIPNNSLICFHTKRNKIGYNNLQYTIRKRYIVYYNEKKEKKMLRLYDFSRSDIETFFEKWRIQQNENISPFEKSEIVYKAEREPYLFQLNPGYILNKEKSSILKNSIIELLFSCFGVLIIYLTKSDISLMPVVGLIITILSVLMFLTEPLRLYFLCQRGDTCPKNITYVGTFIIVDNHSFHLNNIIKVKMTSPRKRSTSIYPTQYFLYFEKNDGTRVRYWLGSESSFSEYSELCNFIADSLIIYSKKLKFI